MFKIKSVTGRIAIGKIIGFIVGIIVILLSPMFGFSIFSMFGFGTLIMFVLMGVMIAFVGQYDKHPVFDFNLSWWLMGSLVGFIFMLMYILLSYNSIEAIMRSNLVSWVGLSSPFWTLLDGAILGAFIAFVQKQIAGKGENLPLE